MNAYLKQFKLKVDQKCNITSMCVPRGAWHIPDANWQEFLEKMQNDKKLSHFQFMNTPINRKILMFDLDLDFEINDETLTTRM